MNILLQVLMPTMTIDMNRWFPDLPKPLHEPKVQVCSLCKQTCKLGRETDQRPVVCLNSPNNSSGHSCEAHLKKALIMIGQQIYISYAFLFGEYLGWSLAFK